MSEELKPCPFCGSRQRIHKEQGAWVFNTSDHKRDCVMRKALSFLTPGVRYMSKEEAIEAWTRRAKPCTTTSR